MTKEQLKYFISTDKYNLLKDENESKLKYFLTKTKYKIELYIKNKIQENEKLNTSTTRSFNKQAKRNY